MSLYSPLQRTALLSHSQSWDSNLSNLRSYYASSDPNTTNSEIDHQNPSQRFSNFVNEDVEMQTPLAENSYFVVPDTNILLHHLDALAAFADDIERSIRKDIEQSKHNVMIIIPSAVVDELDWQKKDNWFSRKATLWIWDKIQHKTVLKGQARNERIQDCHTNDQKILDCALYFARKRPTVLCSADRNLCIEAVAQGEGPLAVLNPLDHRNPPFSSRTLGTFLFGLQFERDFKEWSPTYTENSVIVARLNDDMDMDMDVDTDHVNANDLYQEDARNLLHNQVIDIFVALLRELVASDQRDNQKRARDGAAASIHAPSVPRSIHALKRDVKASDMTLQDLLDYVTHPPSRRPLELQKDNPSLARFLSKPYNPRTGWRKGVDWSRQDWTVALRKLKEIGKAWDQSGKDIVNILEFDLLPHVQAVFGDDDMRV
ncbi:PIN domain-containing protein [Lentinula aff. detonsa]|uniref:PIN domain-containing protein n=1 Tax=Lentinula aff. detonsa TaxID=2804958 RepID=A0AA38NQY2_9AGAR|nr:PIN domain-containing protein [Lentinula aff. detonsa]